MWNGLEIAAGHGFVASHLKEQNIGALTLEHHHVHVPCHPSLALGCANTGPCLDAVLMMVSAQRTVGLEN